ncbi:alpha/beta hydrolase [Deinococcus sp. QL22]|uniref:alpha/beta hydrolase n=1 Tax=Deinococcus sp. QL22 TaxID=2939437 RepID=UPI0020170A6F|nr:alpha/beta hydrolase-fold protein [Deinococcus sp. QL22]UQN05828.1 alpha/beta hydrolase-fold protein [Deinococcus sp. QL22]
MSPILLPEVLPLLIGTGGFDHALIWTPPDFQPSERLPVAYMLDGQNVFLADEDVSERGWPGSWRGVQTASALAEQGKRLVLVAVPHGPNRIAEYTLQPDPEHGGGEGAATLARIIDLLKPLVDSRYGTRTDAAGTALIGSSLGGLLALYSGLGHPQTFGFLGVLSPSMWWSDRAVLKDVAAAFLRSEQHYAVSTGDREGQTAEGSAAQVAETRALHAALLQAGAQATISILPGRIHHESTWASHLLAVLDAFWTHANPHANGGEA